MAHVAMIVSNPCDPDPRVEKEAIALFQSGYDVTIHAFDREEVREPESTIEGVIIKRYRIGFTPTGAPSLLTGTKVLVGLMKFRSTVYDYLKENPPDIVHCHDADTLSIGISLKSKLGVKLVFDMHDLAHSWARMDKPYSIIRRIVARTIEHRIVRRIKKCDLVITSSGAASRTSHPGFREWVRDRVENTNVVVVENRPLFPTMIEPIPEQFTIGYAGKIREKKMFENLIQVVENWPTNPRPKLLIAGYGTADSAIDKLLANSSIEVERIGEFRTKDLSEIINKISVMYAVYPTVRGNILDGALPTKMFDAAIHGRPSIVNSGCLMADIAKAEKLGIAIEPSNLESLKGALLQIKEEEWTVSLKRDWTGESKRLLIAYQNLWNGS